MLDIANLNLPEISQCAIILSEKKEKFRKEKKRSDLTSLIRSGIDKIPFILELLHLSQCNKFSESIYYLNISSKEQSLLFFE